jgi:hypothetical protein
MNAQLQEAIAQGMINRAADRVIEDARKAKAEKERLKRIEAWFTDGLFQSIQSATTRGKDYVKLYPWYAGLDLPRVPENVQYIKNRLENIEGLQVTVNGCVNGVVTVDTEFVVSWAMATNREQDRRIDRIVNRQQSVAGRPVKVYLAGKVAKNDWRHCLMDDLRQPSFEWLYTDAAPMNNSFCQFVGPFPVSCDHGCLHGQNSHGSLSDACVGQESDFTQENVFNKCLSGIKRCDLFFVWAALDFGSAYGTLYEIGVAASLGKKIIIAHHPDLDIRPFWFAFHKATEVFASMAFCGPLLTNKMFDEVVQKHFQCKAKEAA